MFEERVGFYPAESFPPDLLVRIELRVKVGDRVAAGDIVAEAESDKCSQELEAFRSGRIVSIRKLDRGYVLQMEEA